MKKSYRMGGDIFVACAFIAFVVGGFFKIFSQAGVAADLGVVGWSGLIKLAVIFLFFSMALSLLDISHSDEE